ncbi:glycerophosphodiester phosphodiesterase [Roseovarius pacificus]|uniref:glycerophosphodiester phosphodiesterase n=1 Tax=Roseovarius pacificus TaxID=337701 RepID=UPI002A188D96|nr:glycerophosphodiester phosphodiesterase [Roseovarius pacificus]
MKRIQRATRMALAIAAIITTATLTARPAMADPHPYIKDPVTFYAHRGGAKTWPENTMFAFEQAVSRWPSVLLETDTHLTADGELVLIHDDKFDRTTNGTGPIGALTLEAIKKLDAGYKFTLDKGKTFPYRGQGITVPTMREALLAFPNQRFSIELKQPGALRAVEPAVALIRECKAADRVILASFDDSIVRAVREQAPEIATMYAAHGTQKLLLALRGNDWDSYQPEHEMLSLGTDIIESANLTPEEIRKIQAKGIAFVVWTVQDVEEMRHYMSIPVDGIMTDYPFRLAEVLGLEPQATGAVEPRP